MHRNSLLLFEKYAKPYFHGHTRVLEIGPDEFPTAYQKIVGDDTIVWETLEVVPPDCGYSPYSTEAAIKHLTYVAEDEYQFPIADETFDIVLSGQVLEHVRKPWLWIPELARICRSGGHVITVNPVNWPYHEAPVDCWRIYPEGMTSLYEDAGLTTVFAQAESLELRDWRYMLRGDSYWTRLRKLGCRLIGYDGPFLKAVDTISVAVKSPWAENDAAAMPEDE